VCDADCVPVKVINLSTPRSSVQKQASSSNVLVANAFFASSIDGNGSICYGSRTSDGELNEPGFELTKSQPATPFCWRESNHGLLHIRTGASWMDSFDVEKR